MADDAIFMLKGKELVSLVRTPYENEPILQRALAEYPDLIAGQATSGRSGRLLLVRREMPVAGASGSSGLSLDHLFLDASGVPVLVEVKRSSDTRARREVVAQMLDYAANGTAYWDVALLRGATEASVAPADAGEAPDSADGGQGGFWDEVEDVDAFWRSVEDNLRSGRVRLIFLADSLTPELVRIIEFLNGQMRDTEVLGIELPQYVGPAGETAYVPRLVGRTSTAVEQKGGPSTRWDRSRMLDAAEGLLGDDEASLLVALLDDVEARGGRFSWGTGGTAGVTGWYQVQDRDTPVWNVNLGAAPGRARLAFVFGEYATRHPGDERLLGYAKAAKALPELAQKVSSIEAAGWKGWAGMPLGSAAKAQDAVLAVVAAAAAAGPPEVAVP